LDELNARVEDPSLWDDPEAAQKLMRERTSLDDQMNAYKGLESGLTDAVDLIEMGEAEGEEDIVAEAEESLRDLAARAKTQELAALLDGEVDDNNTFVEIHAGAGGTESQDWANMLLRMYVRWAQSKKHKVDIIEESPGEEAGIKSAIIHVKGDKAFGWLKTESGVHRLVRISPYDSNARRHTSFASVWVYPEIDDTFDVDVSEKDVRIDTYRASGSGGQHVNTTDSAVRITHLETGIAVQCQNERSQHKNRATAWNMLRARLYEKEMQEREEAAQATEASKSDIGWGHQIRSYVLQPYQMVKDLRTGTESTNPQAVLDGALDPFMAAALAAKAGGDREEVEDLE
jgi:peptide chain release factor 2